jgi:hypothetical protein
MRHNMFAPLLAPLPPRNRQSQRRGWTKYDAVCENARGGLPTGPLKEVMVVLLI